MPGFIHDKLEIKFLILYITARVIEPIPFDTVWDLAMCDEGVDYFDFAECLSDLVRTEHLTLSADGLYAITDKGREATRIFEKQLPYPVREAAQRSALRVVRQIRRDAAIHTSVTEHGEHDLTVRMEMEQVFAIEMAVVSHEQATMLERTFKANAEAIYQKLLGVMTQEYPN